MKTKLLKMARRLWSNELYPREMNRLNQLKWARAVDRLGDEWIALKRVERKDRAQVSRG
jgi:hypothetical protein